MAAKRKTVSKKTTTKRAEKPPAVTKKIAASKPSSREETAGRSVDHAAAIEAYIRSAPAWMDELIELRKILKASSLTETVKWGAPCYVLGKRLVVGLGAFKSYVGMWFHDGDKMKDPAGVLTASQTTTKYMRKLQITEPGKVDKKLVKSYIEEAVRVARMLEEESATEGDSGGKKTSRKSATASPVEVPGDLAAALKANPTARKAFDAMSPSCRREYANHVAKAKRPETRERRIEKIIPMIAAGGGLHDKYRK